MGSTYTKRKGRKNKPIQKLSNRLIGFGYCLLVIGLFIFILTFYPVIVQEIKYYFGTKTAQKNQKKAEIKPIDEDFGIVIPKIGANAKVIANVNPFNPKEYQWQLTKGVAHAKGSALPNQAGNIFIFAHSSDNWYNANRYNSVFYLLNKLEKGDEINIYFKKNKIRFWVSEKKLVEASQIDYLASKPTIHLLTLMTCWPPGTSLKRLVITASF